MLMISRVNVVDAFAKDIIKRKAFNYVLQTLRKNCPNAVFSGPYFLVFGPEKSPYSVTLSSL